MQNVNFNQKSFLYSELTHFTLSSCIIFVFILLVSLTKITAQCPANLSISNGATGTWVNTSGGSATVRITAIGGGGGKNTNITLPADGQVNTLFGGSGATMIGTFVIPAGATLFAIAGQGGANSTNAGGGGGGSGVVMCGNPSNCATGTILILAGGGGSTSGFFSGGGGQIASGSGNGGTNNGRNGAGGGGLNGNGQTGNNTLPVTGNNYPATGGSQVSKTAISIGGIAGFNNGVYMGAAGGNGMGGGGATDGGAYAAGGGGYSGGNAESDTQRALGGGSFNSGTSQINTNGIDGGGANPGSILIECLSTSCSTPSSFTVTGSGAYCPSQSGLSVGLSGSETGVTYQLKNASNTNVGSPINGSGSSLNFGNQTAGTYTVVATRTSGGCTATMNGSAFITANTAPSGNIAVTNNCGNSVLNLTTSASSFLWSNGQVIEDITVSSSGFYTVTVTGSNSCFTIFSANAVPNPVPTIYSVSGGGSYCSGITPSFPINLSNSELNVNYQLKNGVNNIGNIVNGSGSSLSMGNHSTAGTYTVVATHTNGGCTATMNGSATIEVNDCIHSGVNVCETYTISNVNGNSWYNIYNSTGGIIASINPNGNNLGSLTAKVIDPAGTYAYGTTYYLGRYIEISSSNYPNGTAIPSNYSMRLYYFNTEFNEYKSNANTPSATIQDLNVAWASGGSGCGFSTYISTSTLQGVINNANITTANYGTSNIGFYLQFDLNHLTMFLATTDNANVLPIELGDFRGFSKNKTTILNWETFSENNNRGFDIERSVDAIQFEKIGFVASKGNSVKSQLYQFIDNSPKQDNNYYRLKQIDIDGKFTYSKSIAINQNIRTEIIASPNPSNDIFYLSLFEGFDFKIYNIFGQLIETNIQNGKIDLSNYPPNMYFLEVFDKEERIQVLKLIKE